LLIAFAFTLLLSANANAQKFPDLDKALWMWLLPYGLQNADKLAKVTYSRPQLKDVV
jgi:hypothetical protein